MSNHSPSRIKFTHVRYGRGAQRSIEVAVRTIRQLGMERDEILAFLDAFSATMKGEIERSNGMRKLGNPFIDRAVNRTLLAVSKGQNNLKKEHDS